MADLQYSPSVSTWYERDRAVVRIHGEVNNQTIFALCDEINLAVDYYHYQNIEIQIDSEGGAVASLEYYLGRLRHWRENMDVSFSTLAMTKAASAAAMILSMGDIGKRRAYESTRLLYHEARIQSHDGETWTKDKLSIINRQLRKTDQRIMECLVDHVYYRKVLTEKDGSDNDLYKWRSIVSLKTDFASLVRDTLPEEMLTQLECGELPHLQRNQILEAYTTLSALDVFISSEVAQGMLLIDEVTTDFGRVRGEACHE